MGALLLRPFPEQDAFEGFARPPLVVDAAEQALLAARIQAHAVEQVRILERFQVPDNGLDDGEVVRGVHRARLGARKAHLLVAQLAADKRYLRFHRHERDRNRIAALAQKRRRFKRHFGCAQRPLDHKVIAHHGQRVHNGFDHAPRPRRRMRRSIDAVARDDLAEPRMPRAVFVAVDDDHVSVKRILKQSMQCGFSCAALPSKQKCARTACRNTRHVRKKRAYNQPQLCAEFIVRIVFELAHIKPLSPLDLQQGASNMQFDP